MYSVIEGIHGVLDMAREELEALGKPVCIEKCGKCCEHTVPIATEAEVSYLLSTMGAEPGFKKDVLDKALDWFEHDHLAIDKEIKDDRHRQQQIMRVATLQCPFLNPDKSCAVYQARPFICRTYGVTMAADDWCPAPADTRRRSRPGYMIDSKSKMAAALAKLRDHLHGIIRKKLPEQEICGFLPTMIVREMGLSQFNFLADHHKVQQGKLMLGKALLPKFVEDTAMTEGIREMAVKGRKTGILSGEYDYGKL